MLVITASKYPTIFENVFWKFRFSERMLNSFLKNETLLKYASYFLNFALSTICQKLENMEL